MKSPIVLLTDYGTQDPYAGILHGVIFSLAPKTPVIHLAHGINAYDIRQASIYLESSCRYFPQGSIFVCVVDPGVGTVRKLLCAKSKNFYFIAPDNGLLTDVSRREPFLEVRSIENRRGMLPQISTTFHGRDILAPSAAFLSKNPAFFNRLGPAVKTIIKLRAEEPVSTSSGVRGKVLFFDHFGNAVTNIRKDSIPVSFRHSAVIVKGKRLGSIRSSYDERKKLTAVWNSMNRLEIASPGSKASNYLKQGDSVNLIAEK